jgi:hypothetical protein
MREGITVPVDAKTYLKISGVNFAFLVAGALIGPLVVNSASVIVHAQDSGKAATKAEAKEAPRAAADDPNFEYVTPSISTSTAAFNTVLANRVACDRLTVNGYEPLKLNDAMLAALQSKGILNAMDVQQIVRNGKAEKPLRVKQ